MWTKTLFQKLKTWWAPNGPKHCSSYQNLGEIKIGPKHCFRNWVFARQTNNPSDCALLQDEINCTASSEPDFIPLLLEVYHGCSKALFSTTACQTRCQGRPLTKDRERLEVSLPPSKCFAYAHVSSKWAVSLAKPSLGSTTTAGTTHPPRELSTPALFAEVDLVFWEVVGLLISCSWHLKSRDLKGSLQRDSTSEVSPHGT